MSARLVPAPIVLALVLGAGACKDPDRSKGSGTGDDQRERGGERAPAGGSAPRAADRPATETRMRTYTMEYFAKPELPRVTVTAEIPAAWTETLSARGAPTFAVPGKTGAPPAITAIGIDQPDVKARVEAALELQYGAGTPDVTRTPLDGDRVWAVRKEESVIHARMFIPAPHGVVMAVAIVKPDEADRLTELEAVYRTVRVQAAP